MSNSIPPQSKTALVVSSYSIADPTTRNTCRTLLASGYAVEAVEPGFGKAVASNGLEGVVVRGAKRVALPRFLQSLGGPLNAGRYRALIRSRLRNFRPSLVFTTHLYDLAALPWPPEKYGFKLVSAILDVPVMRDAGRFDRVLFQRAWERIGRAEVVWASDRYKAELSRDHGQLSQTPIVCHNAPNTDYLPEPTWPRDSWLRAELRKQGANLGETGGCIVVRAGAVGEYGGIEETLNTLGDLPENIVFLMMGRPYPEYKKQIETWIAERRLSRRVFLWDRPSDELWEKALFGADVGHLVHGPFPAGRWQRLYQANSSLSNYRLFNYMAAGLPIIAYDDPRMDALYAEVPAFRVCRLAHLTEDLKRSIEELAADVALRERWGRIGLAAHRTTYNWPKQFTAVQSAISNLRGNPV